IANRMLDAFFPWRVTSRGSKPRMARSAGRAGDRHRGSPVSLWGGYPRFRPHALRLSEAVSHPAREMATLPCRRRGWSCADRSSRYLRGAESMNAYGIAEPVVASAEHLESQVQHRLG